jgi:MSHA biogenesis protein MshJ
MMRRWNRLARRIDSLSPRERLMVFAAAAVTVLLLTDFFVFEPMQRQQKRYGLQLAQQNKELAAIQTQIQELQRTGSGDVNAANRARLDALKKQLSELDGFLRDRQADLVPPERIAVLLEQLLEKNRGLQLVSLVTLPVSGLTERPAGQTTAQPAAEKGQQPAKDTASIFRHGVEITVRGSYPELLRYVTELEQLQWQMYWGKARLTVEQYPLSVLTLTVYTLSLDKAWLVV